MNKNKTLGIILLVVAIGIAGFALSRSSQKPIDPHYSTFTIDDQVIQLKNGESDTESIPGSATKTTTKYFGNEASGDLNGDGKADTAFLVTQNTGGSGTFFYVVAILSSSKGYKTSNTMLIGDRIAPQTTEIKDGTLIVNYADRNPEDPMTTAPSVGKTLNFKVTNQGLLQAQ